MITVRDKDSELVWESDRETVEEACMEATLEFSSIIPHAANFFLEVETDQGDTQLVEARIEIRKVVHFYPQD